MKNFKKVLLVSAISVAMLSLFAGCKKAEEATDVVDTPAAEDTLPEDEMDLEGVSEDAAEGEENVMEAPATEGTTSETTEDAVVSAE